MCSCPVFRKRSRLHIQYTRSRKFSTKYILNIHNILFLRNLKFYYKHLFYYYFIFIYAALKYNCKIIRKPQKYLIFVQHKIQQLKISHNKYKPVVTVNRWLLNITEKEILRWKGALVYYFKKIECLLVKVAGVFVFLCKISDPAHVQNTNTAARIVKCSCQYLQP